MLTMSALKRGSVRYYIDTAQAAVADAQRANGGLGEYYTEHQTKAPIWLTAGDQATVADLFGLTTPPGSEADMAVIERWLDDGIAPNGASGRAFATNDNHGYDMTISVPKSVSLLYAFGDDESRRKVLAEVREAAQAGLDYLANNAAYTRVHNKVTGQKDFQKLPGLVAATFLHETNRHGEPHVHLHCIVGRQPRADGQLVAIDKYEIGDSAAKAAGVIFQAHLRRGLHRAIGAEWEAVDTQTGMADIAGIDRADIEAWSTRRTKIMDWALGNLEVTDGQLTTAQIAAAQKATRPPKPDELSSESLRWRWRHDPRGLRFNPEARAQARRAREAREAQDQAWLRWQQAYPT